MQSEEFLVLDVSPDADYCGC